jgi:Holliday junction DNA helicase RuvA
MIAKLKGVIDTLREDGVILDVQGVGYLVVCSTRTLRALPRVGEAAVLHIETQVREDAIRLFGFAGEIERDWFTALQGVQGVGAKVALAILGVLSPNDLAGAIAAQDKAMVARAQGVGPKLAARIVAELKDKAPAGAAFGEAISALGVEPASGAARDAVLALVNLGYARPQAAMAVAKGFANIGAGAETAALIRFSLKELAQ